MYMRLTLHVHARKSLTKNELAMVSEARRQKGDMMASESWKILEYFKNHGESRSCLAQFERASPPPKPRKPRSPVSKKKKLEYGGPAWLAEEEKIAMEKVLEERMMERFDAYLTNPNPNPNPNTNQLP